MSESNCNEQIEQIEQNKQQEKRKKQQEYYQKNRDKCLQVQKAW